MKFGSLYIFSLLLAPLFCCILRHPSRDEGNEIKIFQSHIMTSCWPATEHRHMHSLAITTENQLKSRTESSEIVVIIYSRDACRSIVHVYCFAWGSVMFHHRGEVTWNVRYTQNLHIGFAVDCFKFIL